MTYTPDHNATLLHFDARESEIQRTLPHLKQTLPLREYKSVEAQYAKELRQMNERRKILQVVERQLLVTEIRAAFKACGRLIEH